MLDAAAAWSWRLLVVVAAVAVAAWVLVQLRLVIVPVIAALFLSAALVPLTSRLRARGWPSLLATWVVFGGFLVAAAAIVVFVGTQVADQFSELGDDLGRALDDVERWAQEAPLNLSQDQIDGFREQARDVLAGDRGAWSARLPEGARLAVETIAGALLALTVTFFFVKDGERISTRLLRLVPEQRRPRARAVARASWGALGAYLRGVALTGAVEAAVIGIGLLVVGVPLVVPLMILTFLAAFLPLVGAIAAGVVACLVALVSGGVVDALVVGGIVLVVQQLEGDLLSPLLVGRTVRLHPLVVLLALAAGTVVAGVVGAFLAVPLAAVTAAATRAMRAPPASDAGGVLLGRSTTST
jgi:predicted PurR-regulated permease PerM